ncbi:MAG: LOG family protein [Verrucomicrobiales bacterium]|nr:LOG family protein [Verrucomicrobiales bacterium]MED5586289.1 LOG family protein [Verrucomicrobiota bacterium]
MPNVRLSGRVISEDDPSREPRAQLLYLLFAGGWNIYNSNGDRVITLSNIQEEITRSDAFVFTPGATLEELFKAVSIFVGFQTLDAKLTGKPTVILNSDGSWDPFFRLLDHLHGLGTIKQDYRDYLVSVNCPATVLEALHKASEEGFPDPGRHGGHDEDKGEIYSHESPPPQGHLGDVCVFCSASIEDPDYLADGYEIGRQLADARYGCISGAGKTGIMGSVVQGVADAGGWAGGSNVPHIIDLEGLPDGLSAFWLRPDIYTRMEIMIERSDAFIIFPGGAGTVQEMLALLLLKEAGDPLMKGKPVIVYDRMDQSGQRFWAPLNELLRNTCVDRDAYQVVGKLEDILPAIQKGQ